MSDDRAVADAMMAFGGSFVKSIGEAYIEADAGYHFARAIVTCHGLADEGNKAILREHFGNIWLLFDMSEAGRLQRLRDAFPNLFDEYAKFASTVTHASGAQ